MLRNFFKVSIRNLVRNRTYSLINILGLSIGMACSILIFIFIMDELSYDKYHEKANQIYRVGMDANLQGNELKAYVTGAPVGNIFKTEIPEIIKSTRLVRIQFDESEAVVEYENEKYIESGLFFVDSTFFEIFDVEFIQGNSGKALNTPNKIIITESIAQKYFGNEEVMGKTLNIQGREYLIEGLVKDCPKNSHFHYSILASIISTEIVHYETWMSNDFSFTYLLLDKASSIETIEEKMMEVALKYLGPELENGFGVTLEDFLASGNRFDYILQPITDVHLKSHTNYEIEANSNIVYVYIFSIIACFILVIAIINFMNLSTARSATRAKEVGLRKVVGAARRSLFNQFLFESVVMSFISLIVGMVIIESVLPAFNSFTFKELSLGYFSNAYTLPGLILLAIGVGLVSGLYSASYLSSSKVLDILKGKILSGKSQSWFRSALVIFQFAISVTLFICTFIIYGQLNLLKNKDIGFNKKDIVVIEKANEVLGSYESFKKELESNPIVEKVSASSTLPARAFGGLPLMVEGDEEGKTYAPRMIAVDSDFSEAYELQLKEGRFFSQDFSTDSFAIVINEAAVKEFGLQNPVVGKRLVTSWYGDVYYWNIIGVVKDFNFRSLHQTVDALVIGSPVISGPSLISVKFKTGIEKESIDFVKTKWEKFVAEAPFDYYIMEDDYNSMHSEEFRTGEVFTVFSMLAIFIACLGLFGLASFIAEHKTKEVGIRKALGSSTIQIVGLLLKEFTKWVLWANIIAWPVAYFFMKNWLANFAYQVNIKWWVFIISGILGLLIAIITVSYQAIKAAIANPVNSLRYE